jgi:hypothetical protein
LFLCPLLPLCLVSAAGIPVALARKALSGTPLRFLVPTPFGILPRLLHLLFSTPTFPTPVLLTSPAYIHRPPPSLPIFSFLPLILLFPSPPHTYPLIKLSITLLFPLNYLLSLLPLLSLIHLFLFHLTSITLFSHSKWGCAAARVGFCVVLSSRFHELCLPSLPTVVE